ncbi:zinc-binding alcohol dehydrogenase family protein [Arboricoccus pini]|uniref:Zinc-type alcohol dehydrogenase-like protein n=1 Tax=Arboricoccus pini TaxID=1963835 RepID=A0A212S3Z5_9PROT|nr:zinc-binding alcohol dehydrogenase family protein [Arboricoccus pini]SNB79908.1 zinc-binding alcohol dehydrogenase family protein [Arboricoccus pini]
MKAIGYRPASPLSDPHCFFDFERDPPVPAAHDLLVAVHAVSVNPVDTKVRQGSVPVGKAVDILGWDVAGTVQDVGSEVTLFRPGDDVYYAGSFSRSGGNAELHIVDERIVGSKPSSLTFTQAAALPLTALTAWELLFDRLGVVPGKLSNSGALLIIGGAGGVGSMLIQLARRLTGLEVIATASRNESHDWCLKLGAHHVIDHSKSMTEELAAMNAPPITHIAALNQTAQHWDAICAIIAPQGKLGIITDHDTLDASPLKAKSASLHWEMVFTRPVFATPDMIAQHKILNEVASLVDVGLLRTTVSRELGSLDAASLREAHLLVESGRALGKIVLPGISANAINR